MNLTPKVSLAFKVEPAVYNVAFGANVIECLTELLDDGGEGYNLTDLPVPVAQLTIMNNNLAAAAAAKIDGGRSATEALKVARGTWKEGFTLTAKYISGIAEGNVAFILSTGFKPTKSQTQPASKPGAPLGFKCGINGSNGSIVANANGGVPASKAYVITVATPNISITYENDLMIISAGEETVYVSVNTRGAVELYNLESGSPYKVSMYAVNSAGSGPASAVQQVIPQ